MSFVLANRVQESSLSTGSGNISLAGSVAGYQAFSAALSSGDTTYYTIINGSNWEVGIGGYAPGSLSRDTLLSSSTGSKLNLSGQSFAFICYPSEKSVYRNTNDQVVVTSSGIIFGDGSIQTTASSGGGGGGSTYYAGTGLTLSGTTFHIDNTVIQSGDAVSLLVNNAGYLTSHPSISGASSSNNSGRTYIQDILLDSNGHVTGIATATETVVDSDTTYSAGSGLQLNGTTFSITDLVVKSGDSNTLLTNEAGYLTSHPSISAASSSNNSGYTYIQDILLDSNGHVTGVGTTTNTPISYTGGRGILLNGSEISTSGNGYFSTIEIVPFETGAMPDIGSNILHSITGVLYFNGRLARVGDNISSFVNDSGYLTTHPTIQSASSSNNSGRTYIQDIILDSNGHVTGITTGTETVVDTNTTYSAGSGLNLVGTVFSTSGVGVHSSIIMASSVPSSTANALYNLGGVLHFNGSGVGGGGGTSYTATSGIAISSNVIYATGSLPSLSNLSWSSGIEVPTFTGVNSLSILRVGTNANDLVQMTSGTKLPAVDGSLLTNLQYVSEFTPYYANSGTWLFPPGGASSTIALSANVKYLVPVFVKYDRLFTRIGIAVTTAGALSEVRCGIRRADSNGNPTTLLHEIVTPFDASTLGLKQATISETLTAGMWWLEICPSVACTIVSVSTVGMIGFLGRSHTGSNSIATSYLSRAYTYAALPSDETGVSQTPSYTGAANSPGVGIR